MHNTFLPLLKLLKTSVYDVCFHLNFKLTSDSLSPGRILAMSPRRNVHLLEEMGVNNQSSGEKGPPFNAQYGTESPRDHLELADVR